MAWEDDFLHPLYLLLIGSGVLGVAVALMTHFLEGRRSKQQNALEDRRQRQQNALEDLRKDREIEVERKRKELEIKVDITSKMAEAIASQATDAFNAVNFQKKKLNVNEINARSEYVQEWT